MATIKTTGDQTRITLHRPEELLVSVPSMFGFRPADSLVLLSLGVSGNKNKIGKCIRVDLPADDHAEPVAGQLAAAVSVDRPPGVIAIVVGGGRLDDGRPPPRTALITVLQLALSAEDVVLAAAYWVKELSEGAPWVNYADGEEGGRLPDPATSLVTAELTGHGRVTFGSRAEIEQLFAPDADVLLEQRADLLDQKLRDLADGTADPWLPERGAAAVRAGLRAARSGILALRDDDIAELAVAITDPVVRDACLATALPADSSLATAAAQLWQAMARALPAPERADAACLAGHAAYQQGDGTLAGIAIDVALEANPRHVLAGLLHRVLERGLHPTRLRPLAGHDEIGLCAGLRAA